MRMGSNPNRGESVKGYAPIVVSAITHLPTTEDYHAKRYDVLRCSLDTMRINAGLDCEVMIWDNGSCDKFRDWLVDEYDPDYLILSRNMGKSIARASIVNMIPDGHIIGVADDDMFYYPNWLKKQMEVLSVYPNVGTVSGWPVRTQFRFHCASTVNWAKKNAKVKVGKIIPPNEDKDFCTSIGRSYKWHSGPYTKFDQDVLIDYRGVKAYATGHHAQWIGRTEVIRNYLEYTPEAMADERPFEKAIDDAGLLRLTTYKRYSRHIGNILDKELEDLWKKMKA